MSELAVDVVLPLEGVKRVRQVQSLRRLTRLPWLVAVCPWRRPPSCAEVLDMMRECGQREHSDAMVRTTLDEAACNGDARWKRSKSTQAG